MVFQAVRTRFPLRIAAGMTEWRLLQEAPNQIQMTKTSYTFELRCFDIHLNFELHQPESLRYEIEDFLP
ncbi:MAG: hypothetical protein D4R73_09855 [Deltaproteobacteria bacterium]|nr:MAG: hypothetical protein D4R73_09855 [Deltaproteobacteria bacterium]